VKGIYRRKAHYHETDQMGVIHHANYIRWFEEARIDFMDRMGFGYAKAEAAGLVIPVLGVSCDYKSMVHFDDTVEITSTITAFDGIRMTVSYRITDEATGVLRTLGESRHCFLRGGRPVSLKKVMPELYALFLACVEGG
jgi:acyl-CoA thioester hydrolase